MYPVALASMVSSFTCTVVSTLMAVYRMPLRKFRARAQALRLRTENAIPRALLRALPGFTQSLTRTMVPEGPEQKCQRFTQLVLLPSQCRETIMLGQEQNHGNQVDFITVYSRSHLLCTVWRNNLSIKKDGSFQRTGSRSGSFSREIGTPGNSQSWEILPGWTPRKLDIRGIRHGRHSVI